MTKGIKPQPHSTVRFKDEQKEVTKKIIPCLCIFIDTILMHSPDRQNENVRISLFHLHREVTDLQGSQEGCVFCSFLCEQLLSISIKQIVLWNINMFLCCSAIYYRIPHYISLIYCHL